MKTFGKLFLMMSLVSALSVPAFAQTGKSPKHSPKSASAVSTSGAGPMSNAACESVSNRTSASDQGSDVGTGEHKSTKAAPAESAKH